MLTCTTFNYKLETLKPFRNSTAMRMYIECIHYETIDAYYAEMALNSTRHHLRQHFKVHEIVCILELGKAVCSLKMTFS